MKYFASIICLFFFSCTSIKNYYTLSLIGTDRSLLEIIQKYNCEYPLFVNGIPDSLKNMGQLFPNPCSPGLIRTFLFYLPADTLVTITINNNDNKESNMLVNNKLQAGYYRLSFKGDVVKELGILKEPELTSENIKNFYQELRKYNIVFEYNGREYTLKLFNT